MADGDPGPAQAADLALVEPDAVRQPDAIVEPADPFQIVHGPAAEPRLAPGFLVLRLGEVGVQPDAVARGQDAAVAHQALGDREGRAGGQRDLGHRPVAGLVIAADQPLAVGQDGVLALDHAAWRQPALVLAQAHAAAGGDQPHAEVGALPRPRCRWRQPATALKT